MSERHSDVVVVGAGPAGLSLARDCAALGLDVVVVDPRVDEQWTNTFGLWIDDLEPRVDAEPLRAALRVVWPEVRVVGVRQHQLKRAYGFFDNEALRNHLRADRTHRSEVIEVAHDRAEDGLVVRCADGARFSTRLVVDAGGSSSSLLARHRRRRGGVQSAYGVVTSTPMVGTTGGFTLMDWSVEFDDPTFLYTVDFGDGSVLLEETSLYRRNPLATSELQDRLSHRLGGLPEALETERVEIPMGWGLPSFSRMVVGFGAAAGYVHPVTGYSVSSSLRASERVASSISRVVRNDVPVESRVSAGWDAVWPANLRRTRALHQYGLSALGRLGPHDLKLFFDAFFGLDVVDWSSYLRIDSDPLEIAKVMTKFFIRLPWLLRGKVMLANPLSLVPGR